MAWPRKGLDLGGVGLTGARTGPVQAHIVLGLTEGMQQCWAVSAEFLTFVDRLIDLRTILDNASLKAFPLIKHQRVRVEELNNKAKPLNGSVCQDAGRLIDALPRVNESFPKPHPELNCTSFSLWNKHAEIQYTIRPSRVKSDCSATRTGARPAAHDRVPRSPVSLIESVTQAVGRKRTGEQVHRPEMHPGSIQSLPQSRLGSCHSPQRAQTGHDERGDDNLGSHSLPGPVDYAEIRDKHWPRSSTRALFCGQFGSSLLKMDTVRRFPTQWYLSCLDDLTSCTI
ncbi:hypothetical protein IWX90DRAFT_189343 [Phyllosticta citrichinensis]|uniref:Uncharacterized protein n=1 Tax=Phyllosticta citrichinensis TaxID=1130410 RepID=A0ABR1XWH9_9PEZI